MTDAVEPFHLAVPQADLSRRLVLLQAAGRGRRRTVEPHLGASAASDTKQIAQGEEFGSMCPYQQQEKILRHYACAILKGDGKIMLGERAAHRKA